MPTTMWWTTLPLLLLLALLAPSADAQMPSLYCGLANCYELLGVNASAARGEIAKNYRALARVHHPDRHRGAEDKAAAEKKFRIIADAYEVLKDEDSRRDYDYMLDHPDEMYYNYYRYYHRRVKPNVDIRVCLVVTICLISIVQYISAHHKYSEAVNYMVREHKFRAEAERIAKERGLLYVKETAKRDGRPKMDKQEAKAFNEAVIREVIIEKSDIKGGHGKPSYDDLLVVQMCLLPVTLVVHIRWHARWMWMYSIKGEEYTEEDKMHLIRKNMKMSAAQFDSLDDAKHDEFWDAELWDGGKHTAWKTAKEEEERVRMAQSSKHKSYRRWMKNNGPGQITFADD